MTIRIIIGLQIFVHASICQAIEIPNTPLSVMVQSPPPLIMLLIDDSTSMNDSILAASEKTGLTGYHYVFNDPENNVLTPLTTPNAVIPPDRMQSWQARCCITNCMYYDPRKIYKPWPHWQMISQNRSDTNQANPDCPFYHPLKSSCLKLDDNYLITETFQLSFSHYFMFDDKNENEQLDSDEQLILFELSDHTIHAYEIIDPQSSILMPNLRSLSLSQIPDTLTLDASGQAMTYTSQRQNFANWFSFHRRKELSVRYYLGQLLDRLPVAWIGLYSLNRSAISSVCLIDNSQPHFDNNKKLLLTQIYTYKSHGDSPLRQSYMEIGNYLDTHADSVIGSNSPFQQQMAGDRCRLAYAVILTDGQYNGPSPNIGNRDCDGGNNDTPYDGSFFADPFENTLADITMYFFERDLALEIPDKVSSNVTHQHLIPIIIHFSSTDLPEIYEGCPPNCPQWPEPILGSVQTVIDMFHAAINGRGLFFNAKNPQVLDNVIQKIDSYIQNKQTVVSSGAIIGQRIQTQTQLIETSFFSGDWTGDVQSYEINAINSNQSIPKWSAKNVLAGQQERNIITYSGQSGIPFRADTIDSSDVTHHTINHIYQMPLGDIVHSEPIVVENTVWVASNDSMLHAFDLETGFEKMAYIPKMLWPRLHLLNNPGKEHYFFIDGNLNVYHQDDDHLLCVSLGRGGKGLFCLNIKESNPEKMPMWEYAPLNDPDLGHIQQAYIVKSNYNNKPVVIFGNGYNSDRRQGYLYILNARTGQPLKWNGQSLPKGIPLPASGTDNGLSTPALVDIDSNQSVDLIYAGDLEGNLWKFDCQSSNPNQWQVFFEDANNHQPCPIFQACSSNGQAQPITIRPEVIRHCDSRFEGYLILWGTGKYFEQQDIQDRSIQSIYCIWDWADYWKRQRNTPISLVRKKYLGTFNSIMPSHIGIRKPDHTPSNVTLQKRNMSHTTNTFQALNWDPTASQSRVGWYMDMAQGERVIFPFTYLGENILIVNTFTPDASPCQNGGHSQVYLMNACNGYNVSELFKNTELSLFSQPIEGMIYPPSVEYSGSDQIILYFSSSIPSELMPIKINAKDINGVENIFDGQFFYWKTY